jgi:hypothetical protein
MTHRFAHTRLAVQTLAPQWIVSPGLRQRIAEPIQPVMKRKTTGIHQPYVRPDNFHKTCNEYLLSPCICYHLASGPRASPLGHFTYQAGKLAMNLTPALIEHPWHNGCFATIESIYCRAIPAPKDSQDG